jgi:hypothetical protein
MVKLRQKPRQARRWSAQTAAPAAVLGDGAARECANGGRWKMGETSIDQHNVIALFHTQAALRRV